MNIRFKSLSDHGNPEKSNINYQKNFRFRKQKMRKTAINLQVKKKLWTL